MKNHHPRLLFNFLFFLLFARRKFVCLYALRLSLLLLLVLSKQKKNFYNFFRLEKIFLYDEEGGVFFSYSLAMEFRGFPAIVPAPASFPPDFLSGGEKKIIFRGFFFLLSLKRVG